MGVYANFRSGGGSVLVTCDTNVGQGNGGISLPCAGCYVQASIANTEVVKMNVGAAASAILGIELARPFVSGTTAASGSQPIWIPTDDVSNLYFYSADANAIIDILYLQG